MSFVIEFSYGLAAMAVLILCSAFFSGSEAALFYLRRPDRRSLQSGHSAQRLAAALLDIQPRLRKVKGMRFLPWLRQAIQNELNLTTQALSA